MPKPSDQDAREKTILAMAELRGRKMSGDALDLYLAAIADIPTPDLQRACATAIKRDKFMPDPSTLLEIAGLALPAPPTVADRAVTVWTHVLDAIRSVGAYQSVAFDDPHIHHAIRAVGGWIRICDTDTEELHSFTRKAFLDAYASATRTNPMPAALPGIFGERTVQIATGYVSTESKQIESAAPAHAPVRDILTSIAGKMPQWSEGTKT